MDERPRFEKVLEDTYLLRVPFGVVWTGIILIRGEQNILIDSSHLEPEQYLIPALADLGLQPGDIDWLLNTHVHGDHIGGHHALVTKYGLKTATLDSAADALRDPVKVAIRVRTRFPKNSPPPQSYLKGVEPDLLLKEWRGAQGEDALPTGAGVGGADVARASSPLRCEGDLLAGRFAVVATPGHDDDCLTWVDTKTGTAFTGDSLQANGTPTQGVGFYRSLPNYRATLMKLQGLGLENIVCGHFYDGIGDVIRGADAVHAALDYSAARVNLYGEKIREYLEVRREGAPETFATRPRVAIPEDESVLVPLALKLIDEVGCGRPQALFLALHTVSEHLKELSHA